MNQSKYEITQRVDKVIIDYYNGTQKTKENQHCLEELKKSVLKKKKVTLYKESNNIRGVYDLDTTNRWISLLKQENFKFEYKIDNNGYDEIHLTYSDFEGLGDFYVCLVLIRYLWYYENNHLIYRIFDILDNSKLNFYQALSLAHYYDNQKRDPVFNIFADILLIPERDSFSDLFKFILNEYSIQDKINKTFFPEKDIYNLKPIIKDLLNKHIIDFYKEYNEMYNIINYFIIYKYNIKELTKLTLEKAIEKIYSWFDEKIIVELTNLEDLKKDDLVFVKNYSDYGIIKVNKIHTNKFITIIGDSEFNIYPENNKVYKITCLSKNLNLEVTQNSSLEEKTQENYSLQLD